MFWSGSVGPVPVIAARNVSLVRGCSLITGCHCLRSTPTPEHWSHRPPLRLWAFISQSRRCVYPGKTHTAQGVTWLVWMYNKHVTSAGTNKTVLAANTLQLTRGLCVCLYDRERVQSSCYCVLTVLAILSPITILEPLCSLSNFIISLKIHLFLCFTYNGETESPWHWHKVPVRPGPQLYD